MDCNAPEMYLFTFDLFMFVRDTSYSTPLLMFYPVLEIIGKFFLFSHQYFNLCQYIRS